MLILISYDVNTETADGRKRLRSVAKCCEKYGQRVQNSVFECLVDDTTFVMVKGILLDIIDKNKDSLRFYKMGKNYQNKVEHFGIKESYASNDVMMV